LTCQDLFGHRHHILSDVVNNFVDDLFINSTGLVYDFDYRVLDKVRDFVDCLFWRTGGVEDLGQGLLFLWCDNSVC